MPPEPEQVICVGIRPSPEHIEECDMEDKSTSDRPRDDVKASHSDSQPDAGIAKLHRITVDQLQAAARVKESGLRRLNSRSQAQRS
jgi:hypothetical protein